jgi:hypothetical protein
VTLTSPERRKRSRIFPVGRSITTGQRV